MSKETLVIRISFSLWMVVEKMITTIQDGWILVKDLSSPSISESGWSLKFFCHHPSVYYKYLHGIWMVTKGLSWPFTPDVETEADHKRFRIHTQRTRKRSCFQILEKFNVLFTLSSDKMFPPAFAQCKLTLKTRAL